MGNGLALILNVNVRNPKIQKNPTPVINIFRFSSNKLWGTVTTIKWRDRSEEWNAVRGRGGVQLQCRSPPQWQ